MDVSGFFVPFEVHRLLDLQRVPSFGSLADLAVSIEVNLRLDDRVLQMLDFFFGWPQLSQVDIVSVFVLGNWFGLEVDVDCAGYSEGHDQRRRGQEVGFGVRMHSALEIAISREDGCNAEIFLLDGFFNFFVDFS